MEIIILLAVVLLLGKIKNKNDEKIFRVIAGSILGIVFFFLWPYLHYYIQLLTWEETYVYLSYLTLITVAMSFIILLSTFRLNDFSAAVFFSIFILVWIITYSYEIQLKNKIADLAHFFDGGAITSNKVASLKHYQKKYTSNSGGYTIFIPVTWILNKHKITGLDYFITKENNAISNEFRPKCYQPASVSMSDLFKQLNTALEDVKSISRHCYRWDTDGYACKMTIANNSDTYKPERVRWFGVNHHSGHAVELDFVFKGAQGIDSFLVVIDSIIASVQLIEMPEITGSCGVTASEWY